MLIPLLMDLGMFGGNSPPAPVGVSGIPGIGLSKKKAFRLSELSDGDRRNTAEFLKSHIAQTPQRVAFTQAPMPKAMSSTLTAEGDESIIAVILASDL